VFLLASHALAAEPARYSIQSLRAHFYYQESGRFGSFDLFDPSQVLRNSMIGAGSAEEPSGATLVMVTLSGSFLANTKGAIQLDAKSESGKFPRQTIPLRALFSEARTVTAPFLIYDPGCFPLTLDVRLVGVPGDPKPAARTIPFHCGE